MLRVVFTLLLLVCALRPAPAIAQEWYRLSSAEGAFTAYFPTQPEYKPTLDKNGSHPLWVLELPFSKFQVSFSELRPGEVAKYGAEQLLNGLAHAAMVAFLMERLSTRRMSYGGYPAIEMLIRQGNDSFGISQRLGIPESIMVQRHMLVGNRYYLWIYEGPPGTQDGADAKRFLDSLVVERR
jgi:hypothetical protein